MESNGAGRKLAQAEGVLASLAFTEGGRKGQVMAGRRSRAEGAIGSDPEPGRRWGSVARTATVRPVAVRASDVA